MTVTLIFWHGGNADFDHIRQQQMVEEKICLNSIIIVQLPTEFENSYRNGFLLGMLLVSDPKVLLTLITT
jgi:hypothetical protein